MIDLEMRLLSARELAGAAGMLDPETLAEILDGADYAPGCFALGLLENTSLKAVLAGRGDASGCFELLQTAYNRALRPELGVQLLEGFETWARLEGGGTLLCRYSAPDGALPELERPFLEAGWEKPVRRTTLLLIETPTRDLHLRAKTFAAPGEVLPLGEVPLDARLRYLARSGAQDDFTTLGPLLDALTLAYVENGELLGYIAFAQGRTLIEALRFRLPEDRAAAGVLLSRAAAAYDALGAPELIVRADRDYGERVARGLFGDQIRTVERLMETKKEFGRCA